MNSGTPPSDPGPLHLLGFSVPENKGPRWMSGTIPESLRGDSDSSSVSKSIPFSSLSPLFGSVTMKELWPESASLPINHVTWPVGFLLLAI